MDSESHHRSVVPSVALAVAASLLYAIALLVYRLHFHPLAKFPGPRLAAATFWYEAYYEVLQTGKFGFNISELHDKYGALPPIPSSLTLHARGRCAGTLRREGDRVMTQIATRFGPIHYQRAIAHALQAPSSVSRRTNYTSGTRAPSMPYTRPASTWTRKDGIEASAKAACYRPSLLPSISGDVRR